MELVTEKYLSEEQQRELNAAETPCETETHPSVYIHERCGGATQMPTGVQNNYLADPCWYFLGTICSHCGGGVPLEHCRWVETGEDLHSYMKRLKKNKSRAYHVVRWSPVWFGFVLAIWTTLQIAMRGGPATALGLAVGTLFYAVILWLPARCLRLLLGRLHLI